MATTKLRGCPGFRLITGRTIGICVMCERRDRRTELPPLAPAARLGGQGVWTCDDRVAPGDAAARAED